MFLVFLRAFPAANYLQKIRAHTLVFNKRTSGSSSSKSDIRRVKEDEPKAKMTVKEFIDLRALFKELGITKSPYQDTSIKSNNCGMPYFPRD